MKEKTEEQLEEMDWGKRNGRGEPLENFCKRNAVIIRINVRATQTKKIHVDKPRGQEAISDLLHTDSIKVETA